MRNRVNLIILLPLLIPFAVVATMDEAFAKRVTVDQVQGASNPKNEEFFMPEQVTINIGDTVVWTDSDRTTHTITSGDIDDHDTWGLIFDSGLAMPGATFEHIFDTVDEYPYFCKLHEWMKGKVIVIEGVDDGTVGGGIMGGPNEEKVTVSFEDYSFELDISLTNGNVEFIDLDPDFTSLVLTLQTSETVNGELIINLPRELIDSKINGVDDDFIIIVNGELSDYTEVQTTNDRELTIPISSGVNEIEIVGTQIVPEFPLTLMGIMGVMIATTLAVSRINYRAP